MVALIGRPFVAVCTATKKTSFKLELIGRPYRSDSLGIRTRARLGTGKMTWSLQ